MFTYWRQTTEWWHTDIRLTSDWWQNDNWRLSFIFMVNSSDQLLSVRNTKWTGQRSMVVNTQVKCDPNWKHFWRFGHCNEQNFSALYIYFYFSIQTCNNFMFKSTLCVNIFVSLTFIIIIIFIIRFINNSTRFGACGDLPLWCHPAIGSKFYVSYYISFSLLCSYWVWSGFWLHA